MDKINLFQEKLKAKDIDAYVIFANDYHFSEYLPDHFKSIEYLTGFTGESATLLITKDKCLLWTDGRFFLQAEEQLKGTSVTLMKMGESNVPTLIEYLKMLFIDIGNLGFDGRTVSNAFAEKLKTAVPNANLIAIDLVADIWTENRPTLPFSLLYVLKDSFSGEAFSSKLERVRNKITEKKATAHIISKLEDQAWLYNLRGADIECTPVFLSFTLITMNEAHLFVDNTKLGDDVKKYLSDNHIILHKYTDFFSYVTELKDEKILIDYESCSYTLYRSIYRYNTIINAKNPTEMLKAVKNSTEILNTKHAHIKDGVALVKAIYYLYNHVNELTEISFADYLEERRKEQQGFISLSFPTIAGFRQHGAIVHYMPTKDSDIKLDNEDKTFFLVDSGAHYAHGTTDITRTFALGPVSDDMKKHYTAVLKAAIALATSTFLKGCNGASLDLLARNEMWKLGLDFNHGTGHGVGHILSVHEGPQRISYKATNSAMIVPGMITTDEPGIYIENHYGIRIENELLCVNAFNNEFGEFYKFEMITMCPIDTKAIDTSMLNENEIKFLNNYHKTVYENLKEFLTKDEQVWLADACKEIRKLKKIAKPKE